MHPVVTTYMSLIAGCSLSVRTQRGASTRDNVASLYGAALARYYDD